MQMYHTCSYMLNDLLVVVNDTVWLHALHPGSPPGLQFNRQACFSNIIAFVGNPLTAIGHF